MELDENYRGRSASLCSESEGYIADDETRPGATAMQRLTERAGDYYNPMEGMESSEKAGAHPELAYITPMPQEEKPGFVSKFGHEFGMREDDTTAPAQGADPAPEVSAAYKGVGSSEVGTGYEEDGEEAVNSAAVTKNAEGVKLPSDMEGGYESIGMNEVDAGYEEGSDGSFSHSYPRHFRSVQ